MIEDILSRLTNVQPRGRGYTADCPLHPSKPAVLRVTREFGQVLFECPDSCPDHEIAAALGLTLVDLMEDDDSPGEAEAVDRPAPPEKAPVDLEHPRWNAFDLKPAGQWLAESSIRPVPRQLFGEFWLEDELSILFADTGKGKSILTYSYQPTPFCFVPPRNKNGTKKPFLGQKGTLSGAELALFAVNFVKFGTFYIKIRTFYIKNRTF